MRMPEAKFTREQVDHAILDGALAGPEGARDLVQVLAQSEEFLALSMRLAMRDCTGFETVLANIAMGIALGLRIAEMKDCEVPHVSVH